MTDTARRKHAGSAPLYVCLLPACRNSAPAPSEPCQECRDAFGEMIQHNPDGVPITREQVLDRDAYVRTAIASQHAIERSQPPEPERKRNHLCWLCEQRRTCTLTLQGWECDACREVR